MNWEELVSLLISTGENVHVIRGEGADAVSLQLPPAGWFVSMKAAGELSCGIYEGDENRLVGTRVIPLLDVSPDELRAEIAEARVKQLAALVAKEYRSPSTDPPLPPRRW